MFERIEPNIKHNTFKSAHSSQKEYSAKAGVTLSQKIVGLIVIGLVVYSLFLCLPELFQLQMRGTP